MAHPPIDLDTVGSTIRELAQRIVIPRFRSLESHEIKEKAADDIVTVVDQEMEEALGARLLEILPGSRVVGEEACAADPTLLLGLDRGLAWLVDPLDGTRNFAAGSPHFAVMVGLVKDGEPLAAWIFAPISGTLTVAERGGGAFADGERLQARASSGGPAFVGRYFPPPLQPLVAGLSSSERGTGAAGLEYPALIGGRWSSLLYWRTLPWDHVPGTLILAEAGGQAARLDGAPYRPADGRSGLLAAGSPEAWRSAVEALPTELRREVVPDGG